MPWIENSPSIETSLPVSKGSYVLFLKLADEKLIRLPKFGPIIFPPGIYVYTGSARGNGGLKARVFRHFKVDKLKHWHIDWLRPFAEVIGVYYTVEDGAYECIWAENLCGRPVALVLVPGFGSSDCRLGCKSHLIFFNPDEDLKSILANF